MNRALPLIPLILLAAACRSQPETPPPAALTPAVQTCAVPDRLRPAGPETPEADEIVADAEVAYYMLAVAWGPYWQEGNRDGRGYALTPQDRDVGYFLHGLWPNAAEGDHPRYCSVAPARAMTEAEVREHFCMMPSEALLQHEWAAHGTCGWDDPDAYFDQSADLWSALTLPEPSPRTTAGALRDAWVQANPHLRRDGVYLATTDDGRLREVRLCYDLDYAPTACPRGLGAPDHAALTVQPR
jgi:ribonuclease T2